MQLFTEPWLYAHPVHLAPQEIQHWFHTHFISKPCYMHSLGIDIIQLRKLAEQAQYCKWKGLRRKVERINNETYTFLASSLSCSSIEEISSAHDLDRLRLSQMLKILASTFKSHVVGPEECRKQAEEKSADIAEKPMNIYQTIAQAYDHLIRHNSTECFEVLISSPFLSSPLAVGPESLTIHQLAQISSLLTFSANELGSAEDTSRACELLDSILHALSSSSKSMEHQLCQIITEHGVALLTKNSDHLLRVADKLDSIAFFPSSSNKDPRVHVPHLFSFHAPLREVADHFRKEAHKLILMQSTTRYESVLSSFIATRGSLARQLRINSHHASDLLPSPPLLTLESVQDLANETSASFVFIETDSVLSKPSQIWTWHVCPSSPITFAIKPFEPLFDLHISIRQLMIDLAMQSPNFNPRTEIDEGAEYDMEEGTPRLFSSLSSFGSLLFGPEIMKSLPSDPEVAVILIPQSILSTIPYPALIDDLSKSPLIKLHTMSICPSIGLLHDIFMGSKEERDQKEADKEQSEEQQRGSNLCIGDPDIPLTNQMKLCLGVHDSLSLPSAREEAQEVANLLHCEPLIGEDATLDACIAGLHKSHIVHISSHGLTSARSWCTDEPISALVLRHSATPSGACLTQEPVDSSSPSSSVEMESLIPFDDSGVGLLSWSDVAASEGRIVSDLVVMSSCSTARGVPLTSEGIIALPWAFLAAGARSVVCTLWDTIDFYAANIIIRFFHGLQSLPKEAHSLALDGASDSSSVAILHRPKFRKARALRHALLQPVLDFESVPESQRHMPMCNPVVWASLALIGSPN